MKLRSAMSRDVVSANRLAGMVSMRDLLLETLG